MSSANLEHLNLTVSDPSAFAKTLCMLFDWQVRWQGPAINNGYVVHVGGDNAYIALYCPRQSSSRVARNTVDAPGLNHIGVVVNDLDAVEQRVIEAGFKTHNHASYEPGKRFYFDGPDNIEFEVVSYNI